MNFLTQVLEESSSPLEDPEALLTTEIFLDPYYLNISRKTYNDAQYPFMIRVTNQQSRHTRIIPQYNESYELRYK